MTKNSYSLKRSSVRDVIVLKMACLIFGLIWIRVSRVFHMSIIWNHNYEDILRELNGETWYFGLLPFQQIVSYKMYCWIRSDKNSVWIER